MLIAAAPGCVRELIATIKIDQMVMGSCFAEVCIKKPP